MEEIEETNTSPETRKETNPGVGPTKEEVVAETTTRALKVRSDSCHSRLS